MSVARDLTIATVVLAASGGLLAMAFTKPTIGPAEQSQMLATNTIGGGADVGPEAPSDEGGPEAPIYDEGDLTFGDVEPEDMGEESMMTIGGETTFDEGDIETGGPSAPIIDDDNSLDMSEIEALEAMINVGDLDEVPDPIDPETFEEEESLPDQPEDVIVDVEPRVFEEPTLPGQPDEPEAPAAERFHVVVAGEFLGDISKKYYGTTQKWRLISEANGIGEDVQVGQRLQIPVIPEEPVISELPDLETATSEAPASETTYKIRKGDSYYTIARDKLGNPGRYKEIQQLNGIDPYDLAVGMVIKLPPGSGAPIPESAPVAIAGPGSSIHIVQSGDVLGNISRKYYGTSKRWREIAKANGITGDGRIKVGQKLIIPGVGGSTSAPAISAARAEAPAASGANYVVKKGDSLQEISRKHFGTTKRWRAIRDANPGVNPNRLMVGQKLVIPGATAISSPEPIPAETIEIPEVDDLPELEGGWLLD